MEDLFGFLFNATGRVNRAKILALAYALWRCGLPLAVILFAAAGIAAPVFAVMLVVVLIP